MNKLIAILLVLFLTGCTFTLADGQTAILQTQESIQSQLDSEYVEGALDGCIVLYMYSLNDEPTVQEQTEIYNTCLIVAMSAFSVFKQPQEPQVQLPDYDNL